MSLSIKRGDATPWGPAQDITPYIRDGIGVVSVSTASHGGIFVPDALLARIPETAQRYAQRWSGSKNWYEEDCAWAYVAVAIPSLFDDRAVRAAKDTITLLERTGAA